MVYNEKLKMLLFRKSPKPLILLSFCTHFHKKLVFLLMVYGEVYSEADISNVPRGSTYPRPFFRPHFVDYDFLNFGK